MPSPITTSKPNYTKKVETEKTTFAQTSSTTRSPVTISSSTKRQVPDLSTVFTSSSPWGSSLEMANVEHTISPLILPPTTGTQNQQYNEVSKIVPPNTPQTSRQDNICTSDGFMGDSEDCRKFYRCVANQRGTYTRFEFSCSESTVWDDDTQSCNHAWAVKRSRCGRSGQQSNQISNENTRATTEGSKGEPKRKAQTIQQQLQISYGSKVTQTQTQISNGSVEQNQTQINYGDRTSPKKGSRAKQNQTQISHGSATSQSQTQIDYSDKGVQTQLQIDHSQQSSQSQVQIHESTTRATATSVAQTNTQQGNQCTSSGFMGDTNDCKKFYRCIDNGRGSYMKFEFSCGEGTVWDQSIEACNHAWAVKECGGKGSTGSTSTTHSSTSTPKTTQSPTTASTENYHTSSVASVTEDNEDDGYGQPNQNPTTHSTTTAGPTTTVTLVSSSPSSKGECQSSGFIGDPNDCKIFYRCVENGRGAFTKYEFKCGEGTVWDPDLEACNHAWAVKKCGGSSSPEKVETTTVKQTTVEAEQTTQSTVTIHSSTETSNIDYDDAGYESGNNAFTTTTTTTTTSTTTSRPSGDHNSGSVCRSSGFMGDANDCKKFYRCVDNGNGGYTRYEFSCGEGTVWDSKIDACNHAWAVKNCGGAGSIDGAEETTSQSRPTTSHDVITSSSTETVQSNVSPTSGPSSTSTTTTTSGPQTASADCTRSGFMGDSKDCKKFYRCVDNGNGSYTKYEFACGEGTVWDQKIEACNHAWAVEKCGGSVESSSEQHETSTQYHNTISDEIDDGYNSNQNVGPTSTQSSTTVVATEASKVPTNDNTCVNTGFMGDKNDCKKFYRCVDDGKNGYIRYEFSCGEGTLWDQSIEACNHAWAVKDCGYSGNNTQHVSSETTTHATATSGSEDPVYPQSTEKTTTTLMVSVNPDDQSDICLTEGFKGDRNDCKKFYRCVDNGRGGYTKYEFACGDGTYWNQEILACDHTSSNKNCGGTSVGSTPQNSYSEQDEMQTEATTSPTSSTMGNNNDYSTQKPHVSSGICTAEGFYGDMNDCKKFYRCVDNGKGSYTKYDFTCGDGTVWNQDIQACDHESNNKNCPSRPVSGIQTTETPGTGNDFSSSPSTESQYSTEVTGTSSTSSSSSSSSYTCASEGFFAHPDDCKKFIRCVSNDKGGYTRYEFTCGEGTIWVQDILACDHDTGDSNCKSQSTNKPVTSGENQQTTTEKHDIDSNTLKPTDRPTQTTDKLEDEYDNDSSNKPTQDSGECSSEGFYPNKNDCRQFYRCVDNGKGGYTKYDFTCGEGTAWDSEAQTCNHIDQVKSCQGAGSQPVMHEENNAQATESSRPSNTQATESTSASNTQATESTSTSKTTTTASNQGSTNDNKNSCDNEGYFGDKQDCKKFYRCVDNGKGGYTKYDFTCGEGTIWDQDITTCNHPQDVVNPSCNQQGGSATSTTSSSASGGSSEATTTNEGTDSSQTTSSTQSTTSTQSSGNCSEKEGTKKPENQNITCTKAGYFANPNDCKKFYRCVDWDGEGKRFSVYHFDCGEGTIWDPAVETCNHEESVYPPRDCSGSQSQSENQPSTEQTTTSQQESTTTTEKSTTTEGSTTQSTQSTTSEPSTTELTTTSQASTTQQSSTSEQTTTETSSTSEQTTQQSTTQQSTTSEQTTTQQSTTSEQTTQESTTSEQTTTQSTTSEQTTTQSSTTEQTTTQQSTTSEQTTEQTTTQQSTTSEQTTEQTTTSEQTTTQQSTTSEQTTTEQPTTQESTTSEQTTQESTTSEQTTQESTTSEQTTQESTTEQTTTQQSTTSDSTTDSSTTEQSTTQQSTTAEQTEQSTTEESTTSESTTAQESTTEQSTTESQDNSTTESSTSEQTSESKCPETDDDQNLFVCPTSFRRHPKYCNLFYQCDEEDDTHDVKIAVFTCPNNTIYDESQTRCVDEKKAEKKCDGQIAQKRRFKRFDMDYKEPVSIF